MMGDEVGDLWDACRPVHPVRVSSFYMAKFLVTQRLYKAVMGKNPSYFKGDLRPVETVSWDDAQLFIKKLNEILVSDDVTLNQDLSFPQRTCFRLPTEAEWEYTARGGIYSQGYTYAGSDKLKQVGWHDENSDTETCDVGLLLANDLGIYDISGNVYEWCEDWFDEEYYEKCKQKGLMENPLAANDKGYRVIRGGSYYNPALYCRPTYRTWFEPNKRIYDVGFRLCLANQLSP